MERVRHPQPGRLGKRGRYRLHLSLNTGDDDRVRPVHGRDGDAPGEQRRDLSLSGPDSHHRPTSRQGLHESCSGGHQTARVLKRQHTRHMRRRDLTDRMTREMVGPDTKRLNQPVESHLDGEQRRLRPPRLVEQFRIGAPHHIPQTRAEVSQHLVQRRREDRETGVQLAAHAQALRALTREEHREGPRPRHAPGHLGHTAGRGQQDRPVVEDRAAGQREPDAGRRCFQGAEPRDLGIDGSPGLGRHRPWDDRRSGSWLGDRFRYGLFQDHVRVRAADPERRHRRPARPVGRWPGCLLSQQLDGTGRPVHMRRRRVHVQRLRHDAVPHRLHHLDHTSHTGGRLGVTEVRLDRAEQQRPLPVPPIRGKQRLRLDRVTQRGTRTVPLHYVHIGRRQTAAGQCLTDHPLLRRPVRRGQTVRRTVLVHRRASDDCEDPVPVADRVGLPLQHEHAHALGPPDPVGAVRECAAPAVRRQPALPRELHERVWCRDDRHATRQRERAFAAAECLHRPVHRDEGRGAGGVHSDRRPFQAEGVGDPAGSDAARAPLPLVALVLAAVEQCAVVVVHDAREDAGLAAAQRHRVDAGPLEGLPRDLQQKPLLGVGGECLAG
ncbi:hypothetical protein Psuf_016400 [Phytohabitans suffuscus]|uniref:Uncharacterized protein n=1 Tax=Phytohabitans suffuscus TaxID=624315 RepID=A0A6F8YE38_9ACTN|nr:hypothetical protein Psuf_016400 [Phytohabitans suffuscus]